MGGHDAVRDSSNFSNPVSDNSVLGNDLNRDMGGSRFRDQRQHHVGRPRTFRGFVLGLGYLS